MKNVSDRIITCLVEYDKEKITTNFSSRANIRDVKSYLIKDFEMSNPDKKLIKLYHDGKELKQEGKLLGAVTDKDIINLTMVCITLTDDLMNDEKKIEERIIRDLVRFCEVHKDKKALSFCVVCPQSICQDCEKDHVAPSHKVINKNDIIKYEHYLKQIHQNLSSKFKLLGLDTNYSDFYKNFKQNIGEQCEELINISEQIKKKEMTILNGFKINFESIFPFLLDYRDKVDDLIKQVTESKKETILKKDQDFLEFYQKYVQMKDLKEKAEESIDKLKNKLEKYKQLFTEFKSKTQNILNFINEEFEKIKEFQITDDSSVIHKNPGSEFSEAISKKDLTGNDKSSLIQNGSSSKINLYNLMFADRNKANILKSFDGRKEKNVVKSEKGLLKRANSPLKPIKEVRDNKDIISEINDRPENLHDNIEIHLNLSRAQEDFTQKIANIEISTNNIYLFSNIDKTITKKEIDLSVTQMKKFEAYHSTLNFKNKFYISGGYGTAKMFYELNIDDFSFKKLKDMLTGHSYHTLLGIKNYIFAISGFKSKRAEKYSLENDIWVPLADLNLARSWPSCINIDDQFIYVIGGLNEPNTIGCKVIEKLDLKNASSTWDKIELNYSEEFPFYSGIFKLEKDQIVILGGKYDKKENNTDKCLILNLVDFSINVNENKLPSNDEFDGRLFMPLDDNTYAHFSSINPNKFYIYEKGISKFNCIEFKEN